MRSLEGLNSEQLEAVRLIDRHLLVVAGAGSGKTRVLTHKISYLIEEHGISPSSVLAMTFSNRAANEMIERVAHLLPTFEQPRFVGTFHSICLRILKEFSEEAGLSHHFSIYDEADQLSAIKRVLNEMDLDPKKIVPQLIRYHIDRAKNETSNVVAHILARGVLPDVGLRVVERYQETLKANNALDFGDLLIRAVELIKSSERVRQTLRTRFSRILVDEYQDTNQIQKRLVQELAGPEGIVCAVGDEDQSIYSWRGARVENMLEFEEDFPGAAVIKLERNYRSTKKILEVANHVISHNVGRREKKLWTENHEGQTVRFVQLEDDYAEARFVLDEIEELLQSGQIPTDEISIFYRTNAQSRLLEEECRKRNLHYRIFGGIRFYDRAEVKNALAYLRLALNPGDNISFARIINIPSRGIGDKTIDRLARIASERASSYLDAIPFLEGNGKAEKALRHFLEWFTLFRFEALKMKPHAALEEVLKMSGYYKALEVEGTIESESRLENLNELLRSMEEFSNSDAGDLSTYLDRISLVSDIDDYDQKQASLTMMTVHNSKGLEFDAVFVVGMEEGIFPHHRSISEGETEDDVEEERRLCYVAMTRAGKFLTLSAAAKRKQYQSTQFNPVSRFINEIPSKLLDREEHTAFEQGHLGIRQVSYWGPGRTKFAPRQHVDEYRQESYDDDGPSRAVWAKAARKALMKAPYPPGSKVMHPDFGVGTVRKCEGHEGDLKLTVEFIRGGLKKLKLNSCSLELLERS